jgi:hypothetical protein
MVETKFTSEKSMMSRATAIVTWLCVELAIALAIALLFAEVIKRVL